MSLLQNLINAECNRLTSLGYDYSITPDELNISKRIRTISLDNNLYILTGFRGDDDDIRFGGRSISLFSPTGNFFLNARTISYLGTGIFQSFRRTLTIKTYEPNEELTQTNNTTGYIQGKEYLGELNFGSGKLDSTTSSISPYTLEFVKIIPIRKN